MRPVFTCLLYCILLLSLPAAQAQVYNRYHADLYNGLPSNWVYSVSVDNHGYLWVCTDKGIARYNGYEYKIYTTDDGLPSNEVWSLIADRQGRLWPGMISRRVGYIRNNRYRDIHVPEGFTNFYIGGIINYAHGIFFFNGMQQIVSGKLAVPLFHERNDSLIPAYFYGKAASIGDGLLDFSKKGICRYTVGEDGNVVLANVCPDIIHILDTAGNLAPAKSRRIFFNDGSLIITWVHFTNELVTLDMAARTSRTIKLFSADNKPAPISTTMWAANSFLVCTIKDIFEIDKKGTIENRTPVHVFTGDSVKMNGSDVTHIYKNPLWGVVISTSVDGFYLNHDTDRYGERELPLNLADYICLDNRTNDTVSYWWSDKFRILQVIRQDGSTISRHYSYSHGHPYQPVRMVPYTKDDAILVTKEMLYLYNYKSGTATPMLTKHGLKIHTPNLRDSDSYIEYTRDLVVASKNHFYAVGNGLYDFRLQDGKMTMLTLKDNRYYHILNDTVHEVLLTYYIDQMLLYNIRDQHSFVLNSILKNLGITEIENLAIHAASGNIFLKDHTRLLMINPLQGTVKSLFTDYNLREAKFSLKDNLIILAGKFGLLFSKIKSDNSFTQPVIFHNFKNNQYFQVHEMTVMEKTVLLKTDRKVYMMGIPPDSAFAQQQATPDTHRMVLQYHDSLYDIPATRLLNITSASDKLLLDVISPEGNGTLRFRYHIKDSSTWHELNGNELKLPPMEPGRHRIIFISAADDAWISKEVPIVLYMVPEWWQTPIWTIIIKTGLIIIVLLLLLAVILITRHFVNRAAYRKQLLTSLEYRVIHSQINPHFIFNTLNTALYFIKKEKTTEAVAHVSRFSRLLRGYLEASQKRYISIADEIANLKSYIELQQTRFEYMFSYSITVVEDLAAESVYIPSLLLQPLVENAINHGLTPRGPGGWLNISFSKNGVDSGIVCIIDDNGIGRKQSAENRTATEKRVSHGSRLTDELVDLFNRYEKMGIEIIYTDKEKPHPGTCVTIIIKQPRHEPK